MRKFFFLSLSMAGALWLAGCSKSAVLEEHYEFSQVKIIASSWIAADSLVWADTTFSANAYKSTTLYEPQLTEGMLATGAILVYAKTAAADSEQPLPYKVFDDTGKDHDVYNVKTAVDHFTLLHTKVTNGTPVKPTISNKVQFRYVLIQDEPTPNTRLPKDKAAGFLIADLKKMKYKDVIKIFKIKDCPLQVQNERYSL